MPLCFLCILVACTGSGAQVAAPPARFPSPAPATVGDIPLPEGYRRIAAGQDYASFLRGLRLRSDPTVYLYNGTPKKNQEAQYAVLDIDAGKQDLQQCADAVMRLRAEFLFRAKQYDRIGFYFTNGFHCDYRHYAAGYRLHVTGGRCQWVKQAAADDSYDAFRRYLNVVYAYAGTRSLHAQLAPLPFEKMRPGSVLIRTGDPYGHAVTVMDMASHPGTGDTVYLLSQSYMPAQDIHILRNPADSRLSPWYSIHAGPVIETPEWTFTRNDLRTF